jgi:hypothetical protein
MIFIKSIKKWVSAVTVQFKDILKVLTKEIMQEAGVMLFIIPILRRWRQKDHVFEASLG